MQTEKFENPLRMHLSQLELSRCSKGGTENSKTSFCHISWLINVCFKNFSVERKKLFLLWNVLSERQILKKGNLQVDLTTEKFL
jgi:hypothetical protein